MLFVALATASLLVGTPLPRAGSSVAVHMSDAGPKPLPPLLAEWGCDEELWSKIKNRRSLEKLASKGEEEHAKKRIASLRETIANAPLSTPAPTPTSAAAVNKNRKKQIAKIRKEGPYELFGEVPAGMDAESISALVEKRSAAKVAKDYAAADKLREELKDMGVVIRDDLRSWYVKAK